MLQGHRIVDAKRFKMRVGPRYKKEKKKAPSGLDFYFYRIYYFPFLNTTRTAAE